MAWTPSYGGPASNDPWSNGGNPVSGDPYGPPPGFDIGNYRPWAPAVGGQTAQSDQNGVHGTATQNTDANGHPTGGNISYDDPVYKNKGSYGAASGDVNVDPTVGVQAGGYIDPATGKQTYGANAAASAGQANGKIDFGNGNTATGQANGPSAQAGVTANDSTFGIGAQASVADASVTAGTKDAKSAEDESFRFGLSEGVGAAARVHYGDADKDGHPEYGFGADVGPFSFDVKSEDPVRTAADALLGKTAVDAAGSLFGVGADAKGNPSNMTDGVGQAASDMWNWVTG